MTGSGMEDIIKLIKSFDCMGWMTGRWRKGICLLSALMPSIFVMIIGIASISFSFFQEATAPRYAGLLTSQPLVAATLYGDAIRRK